MNTAAIPDDYSLALPYPVTAAIIDQSMTDILEPFDQWQRSEHTEGTTYAPCCYVPKGASASRHSAS